MNRNYVDGPGFVEWLKRVRPEDMSAMDHTMGDTDYRAITRARAGGAMKLEVADRICCKLFLHIDSEMPEHLWRDDPKAHKPGQFRSDPDKIARCRELLKQGVNANRAAREVGLSRRTVLKVAAYEGLKPDPKQPGWQVREAA